MKNKAERVRTPNKIQGAIQAQRNGKRLMSSPQTAQKLLFPHGLVHWMQRSWGCILQVAVIKNQKNNPPVPQRIHLDSSRSFEIIVDKKGADFDLLVSEKGEDPVRKTFHFPQYTLLVFNTFHAGAAGTQGCENVRIHGYLGVGANENTFGQRFYDQMLTHASKCQEEACETCKERDKLMWHASRIGMGDWA
jgi:hypothetical protein